MASKFDNRMKEFAERWEVDKYLAASGYLPPQVRPFFLALPKVCPASSCWFAANHMGGALEWDERTKLMLGYL